MHQALMAFLALSVLPPALATEPDLKKGLVAHYTFDKDASDSSGNGHHATARGAKPVTEGKLGGAFVFNGTSDCVAVPPAVTKGLTWFTIALWFKTTQSAGSARTTHNPFFTVTSALVSRSQIFEFKPLTRDDLKAILRRALSDQERGLGTHKVALADEALDHLAEISDGDARRALNALEVGVLTTPPGSDGVVVYDLKVAEDSIQHKAVVYDRDEDAHYDAASAFIKSMRGSDPDAALYWMAKMLEGGEDPRFVARRIVICAAEDVGNAQPLALVLASAALQVAEFVGMPEARIPLAQAVTYIATCPKSNAAYVGIDRAMEDVREGRVLEVPEHLRDASYRGAKRLGRGEGYQYAHEGEGHFVAQEYIPVERSYYEPTEEGAEKQIKERLEAWKKRKHEQKSPDDSPA